MTPNPYESPQESNRSEMRPIARPQIIGAVCSVVLGIVFVALIVYWLAMILMLPFAGIGPPQ